ncbi:hypothetical protein [Occallatibacter riparius]|uniref:Uncharacterized protein n=1 Tax=Occallatibacter riparius TaxID=1002689 RepID=A0A9J7BIJ4_9BACT|nr:hypothetical protein [Occallatibacter riparius]UWZ82307.1 hypothetical protein MOP44_17210 [Occallatibacter riparius]
MGIFDKFLKKNAQPKSQECVLIRLDGVNLPDEVYAKYDVATLEDQLIEEIETNRAGELDGHETGDSVTTIYLYGPDANRLYDVVEPVLKDYPLCKNARVVIRKGGPGSPQSEVQL